MRGVAATAGLVGLGAVSGCTGGRSGSGGTTASAAPPSGSFRFPRDFLWGAATSAYQVEGAAAEDGRGPSVWDTFAATPGRVRNGDNGDRAADQYHRYREDVALMRDLGLRAYRFSVSWPRVLPEGTGAVNQAGLDYYRRLVDELLGAQIEPVVTLWHWDTPQALQDVGGWENRDVAVSFGDYAAVVGEALGDRVTRWLTLNEPKTVVDVGYRYGVHAPGYTDEAAAATVTHHLALGHGHAVRALRTVAREALIAPCLNLMPTYPADGSAEAKEQARLRDVRENTLYLDPILRGSYPSEAFDVIDGDALRAAIHDDDLEIVSAPVDWLGVNYYNPVYVDGTGQRVQLHEAADPASWLEIYPEGLYDMVTRLDREYAVQMMVTENGRPDGRDHDADGPVARDDERIEFLRTHLVQLRRAMDAGADVRGYLAWSLLDNFEWSEGYAQRFGLVHVDFDTQIRTPKLSASWYRDVIAAGAV